MLFDYMYTLYIYISDYLLLTSVLHTLLKYISFVVLPEADHSNFFRSNIPIYVYILNKLKQTKL